MGKEWKQWMTIFGGSNITADGYCSHEIKRHLLPGRKVMNNLERILKSRDITLSTKFCLVKAMVFPVVMYGCESWTIKEAEHQRIYAFELWWCWRRLLRSPLGCKEIQPVHPKRSVLNIHWKDWCRSWNSNTLATWYEELTHLKRLWIWERLKAGWQGDDRGWDGWMTSLTQWTWLRHVHCIIQCLIHVASKSHTSHRIPLLTKNTSRAFCLRTKSKTLNQAVQNPPNLTPGNHLISLNIISHSESFIHIFFSWNSCNSPDS